MRPSRRYISNQYTSVQNGKALSWKLNSGAWRRTKHTVPTEIDILIFKSFRKMFRLVTTLLIVLLVTSVSVFGGDLPEVSERSTSASGNHSGSTTETPTRQTTKLLTQNMTTTTTTSPTKKETPSPFESVFFFNKLFLSRSILWTRLIDYFLIWIKRRSCLIRKMVEKMVCVCLTLAHGARSGIRACSVSSVQCSNVLGRIDEQR